MMQYLASSIAIFVLGQTPSEPPPADYSQLSKLVQSIVVKEAPKEFVDKSDWGKTIPIPAKLRLPNLRSYVKVGDRDELPHGLWKKVWAWLDDPAKDLDIQIRDLRKLESGKGYRVHLDATMAFNAVQDVQHWQKGLATFGFSAQAKATITARLELEVGLELKAGKFPPEIKVEPKVVEAKLLLKDFELQRVRPLYGLGASVEGDKARDIGNDLKGVLQSLLTGHEAEVREKANRAIARALEEGKGNISAGSLFKSLTPQKSK
ncbi:MAG: hypothetical protein HY040_04730 [Planctomycetes bacterium]|nr:hypothetical protein [Planctomycetota bacterium]